MSDFGEVLDKTISTFDAQILLDVAALLDRFGVTISIAESLTGGMVAEWLTRIPGSSSRFIGAVVCYNPRIKISLCGVLPATLRQFGDVSQEVAKEMADGIRRLTKSGIGISTTGLAGPSHGQYSPEAIGTVFIGFSFSGVTRVKQFKFDGDRSDIRQKTVEATLMYLKQYLMAAYSGSVSPEDL